MIFTLYPSVVRLLADLMFLRCISEAWFLDCFCYLAKVCSRGRSARAMASMARLDAFAHGAICAVRAAGAKREDIAKSVRKKNGFMAAHPSCGCRVG